MHSGDCKISFLSTAILLLPIASSTYNQILSVVIGCFCLKRESVINPVSGLWVSRCVQSCSLFSLINLSCLLPAIQLLPLLLNNPYISFLFQCLPHTSCVLFCDQVLVCFSGLFFEFIVSLWSMYPEVFSFYFFAPCVSCQPVLFSSLSASNRSLVKKCSL